ncbi:MAG: alpha/beta fold hydrolase [Pyrinomonadaceae bacterium]
MGLDNTNAKFPIILAHGIARFDFLVHNFTRNLALFNFNSNFAADELHYFKGIARHLRNHGFDVYESSVGFASGVERRAEELSLEVRRVLEWRGAEKAHIIGHSMGGLDARHMIVRHDMSERVASLTTVGTPHLGTTLADLRLAEGGGEELIELLNNVIDLHGFHDLTTEVCQRFNDSARNTEAENSVVYQTYASAEDRRLIFTPLQRAWKVIHEREGDNDGLVSLVSQSWQPQLVSDSGKVKTINQHRFPVPADHLNEIGWWDLNQLRDLDAGTSVFRAAESYEAKIRDVYLDIARSL